MTPYLQVMESVPDAVEVEIRRIGLRGPMATIGLATQRYLRASGEAVASRLSSLRLYAQSPAYEAAEADPDPQLPNNLDNLMDDALVQPATNYLRPSTLALREGFSAGWERAMSVSKSLGALDTKSDLFSVRNVTARDWSAREAGRLISKTSDTTKNEIRDIVTNGVENGHSYQKIAKAIRDKYKDSGEFSGVNKAPKHLRTRADLIASTEMGNAYEQGKREVMNRVSRTTPMEKKWLAVGDERTSDECRANDAQDWIGNDERFNSGHDCPLEHPGCRCTLTYRVA